MTDLPPLLERVKAARGPDRELGAEVWLALERDTICRSQGYHRWAGLQPKGLLSSMSDSSALRAYAMAKTPDITSSLDAAIALTERVLPGWEMLLSNEGEQHNSGWVASIGPRATFTSYEAEACAPALALLAATIAAVIAKQES